MNTDKKTKSTQATKLKSDPGRTPDKVIFGDKLLDAMMARWEKTHQFMSEADLEALAMDCLAVWENTQDRETVKILRRILNKTHYLAVAGSWSEFLDLLGFSRGHWDWNRDVFVCPGQGKDFDGGLRTDGA